MRLLGVARLYFKAARTARTEYQVINMIFDPKPAHQFTESWGKNDPGRQDVLDSRF